VQIRANRRGAGSGDDPEFLHQLRVGIRRLRSTLLAFGKLLRRKPARRFDRALRQALRAMGPARDWDAFLASQPEPRLRRAARRASGPARARARRVLASEQFRALPDAVLGWARGRPWRTKARPRQAVAEFSRQALRRLHADVLRAGDGIDWSEPDPRHRLRIRIKRLRYGCDCFAAGWSASSSRRLHGGLRELQELLGELNDIRVQLALLRGLGRSKALAAARQRLREREGDLVSLLPRAWKDFAAIRPYWDRRAAVRG
jgi:CHAD domain-containing protein